MGLKISEFETPKENRINSEQYHEQALAVASKISSRWGEIKKMVDEHLSILFGYKFMSVIYGMTEPPKTGIQIWFENQVKYIGIRSKGDEEVISRMMRKLKEDLEEIEKEVDGIVKGEFIKISKSE